MERYEYRREDYSLDTDQDALRRTFREFFEKESPTEVVRAAQPTGFDSALWQKLARLGAVSMALPTTAGGDGAGLVELALVAEELGRAAAPVPLISHVVAARLLVASGADRSAIEAALSGDPITIALARQGDKRQLVPDASISSRVVALDDDGLAMFVTDQPNPPVPSQGHAAIAWWSPTDAAIRTPLLAGDAALAAWNGAVAEWKLLTAASLVGLSEGSLDLAVDFAKTRRTLGVPIGALQGVSFPLADIAIGIAGARNLVWRAAWMREHEPSTRPELALMAFQYARQVSAHAVTTAQHTHGGLGFAEEADISLYFRRAKSGPLLAGDPHDDLRAIGSALLATP